MKAPLSPLPLSPLKGERGVDSKDVKNSNFEGWANERMRARHLRSQGGLRRRWNAGEVPALPKGATPTLGVINIRN